MTAFESEQRTRKARIDPKLKSAGWTTITPFRADLDPARLTTTAIEEYETANGPADYALCDGGKLLGVVEAKKVMVGPQAVMAQAERVMPGALIAPRSGRKRTACRFSMPPTARSFAFTTCATPGTAPATLPPSIRPRHWRKC